MSSVASAKEDSFIQGRVVLKKGAQGGWIPVALTHGEQLVTLLMEHGIGAHRSTPALFEIDEEFATQSQDK